MQKVRIAAMGMVLCMLCATTLEAAADAVQGRNLLRMKSGTCTFTLLQKDGVTPVKGATLTLLGVDDGKSRVNAVSDKTGTCVADIAAGRYILQVDRQSLAVLETAEASDIRQCRVIVPDKPMVVGGQEEAAQEEEARNALVAWLMGGEGAARPIIVGGVAILAGTGGYLIYENNDDDDDDGDDQPAPVVEEEEEDEQARRPGPTSP